MGAGKGLGMAEAKERSDERTARVGVILGIVMLWMCVWRLGGEGEGRGGKRMVFGSGGGG